MATTRRMPSALVKYRTLRKKKKMHCAGKTTKTELNKAKSAYVTAAVKGGQTKAEATKKANKVVNAGCKLASMAGTRKKAAPKRKPATRATGKSKTRTRARA